MKIRGLQLFLFLSICSLLSFDKGINYSCPSKTLIKFSKKISLKDYRIAKDRNNKIQFYQFGLNSFENIIWWVYYKGSPLGKKCLDNYRCGSFVNFYSTSYRGDTSLANIVMCDRYWVVEWVFTDTSISNQIYSDCWIKSRNKLGCDRCMLAINKNRIYLIEAKNNGGEYLDLIASKLSKW